MLCLFGVVIRLVCRLFRVVRVGSVSSFLLFICVGVWILCVLVCCRVVVVLLLIVSYWFGCGVLSWVRCDVVIMVEGLLKIIWLVFSVVFSVVCVVVLLCVCSVYGESVMVVVFSVWVVWCIGVCWLCGCSDNRV